MTPLIRHAFIDEHADGPDTTVVRPSDWNAPLEYTDANGVPSGETASIRRVVSYGTVYVRTDGDDANDGSADDAGHAFLTLQAAAEYARANIDPAGTFITIKVADGTYTDGVNITGGFPDWSYFYFEGNTTTPGNVIINTVDDCFLGTQMVKMWITGFRLQSSAASGFRVNDTSFGVVGNIEFGTCALFHIAAAPFSAMYLNENYTIVGGAFAHLMASQCSSIESGASTVTLTGTPAFTNFVYITLGGTINVSGPTIFSGAATGRRWRFEGGGSINTGSGSPTFFPGNLSGIGDGNYDQTVYLMNYAKASLPTAAVAAGLIYVTDDVGGAVLAFSDGTNWRRVTDRNVVA